MNISKEQVRLVLTAIKRCVAACKKDAEEQSKPTTLQGLYYKDMGDYIRIHASLAVMDLKRGHRIFAYMDTSARDRIVSDGLPKGDPKRHERKAAIEAVFHIEIHL